MIDPNATVPSGDRAKIVGGHSAVGRGRDYVLCPCGHTNRFYTWSWAGNGKGRCKGCGKWIMYATLAVVEPTR